MLKKDRSAASRPSKAAVREHRRRKPLGYVARMSRMRTPLRASNEHIPIVRVPRAQGTHRGILPLADFFSILRC